MVLVNMYNGTLILEYKNTYKTHVIENHQEYVLLRWSATVV